MSESIVKKATGSKRLLAALSLLLVVTGAAWFLVNANTSLPDFSRFPAGPERKQAFFTYLRPLIEAENHSIRSDRERLRTIAEERQPGWFDRRWMRGLATTYGIDATELANDQLTQQLLWKVDTVPISLALAQAAKESGWGTSRFAKDGNNLFGEWCFDAGCGIVPRSRSQGATHEVESFVTPRRSVESYLNNINSHPKYAAFRDARASMRSANQALSSLLLAEHLSQYSERRSAYVEELKQLIRTNRLENR